MLIEGAAAERRTRVMIECKDYKPHSTGPIGVEYVDAIDSKRRDLRLDAVLICSNGGFTDVAIPKGIACPCRPGQRHA